jgi:hypothetical protein
VFKGALVSASSLELVSFFGSIISHVRSYYNTTILCSHYDHHLSSREVVLSSVKVSITKAKKLTYKHKELSISR